MVEAVDGSGHEPKCLCVLRPSPLLHPVRASIFDKFVDLQWEVLIVWLKLIWQWCSEGGYSLSLLWPQT